MASGLLIDYLGSGIIADRPVAPSLFTGSVGIWYATDTGILSAWDGTTWNNIAGGVSDFIDLGDVPASYAGAAGDFVKVKATEDGLEFGTGGSGGGPGTQANYARTVSTTAASTTNTSIPIDNTIPQITEGVAYASLDTTITPTAATSLLEITVEIPVAISSAGYIICAVFRDAVADAIGTSWIFMDIGQGASINLRAIVAAGSTSATTFRLRWCTQVGTGYILQVGGTSYFGASHQASMVVREIAQ